MSTENIRIFSRTNEVYPESLRGIIRTRLAETAVEAGSFADSRYVNI